VTVNSTGLNFDEPSLQILRKLVNVLVPLDAWIKKRTKEGGYKPPNADHLPWRKTGASLTTDDMGVVEFVVSLIRESAGDVPLLERWHAIQADPLKYCPFDSKDEWRSARGLDGVPRFGIDAIENMPSDDSGRQMARSQVYADYLPLLIIAAQQAKLVTDDEWAAFTRNPLSDSCDQWSQGSRSYRSSKFMLQLLRDVLYATLGMRNPVAEPWRSALLTEIGEFRRPGNVFDRSDIENGLKEFASVLKPEPLERSIVEEPRTDVLRTTAATEASQLVHGRTELLSDSVRDHYLEFDKRRL
jgi:hypothetical protein